MSYRQSRGSPPQPFEGDGEWLNRSPESVELTSEKRCARARSFLRRNKINVPEEILEVLAYCDSGSEIWFVYYVISTSGWRRVGLRSLSNGVYRLTVKATIEGDTADVLFEDLFKNRRVVFEIQGPQSHLSNRASLERARLARIASKVDKLYPIPASRARYFGRSFRQDLVREQFSRMRDYQEAGRRPGENLRYWHSSDLGYDVTEIPYGDRLLLVKEWVKTRGLELSDAEAAVLAHCDRAGEIIFALQLIRLPQPVVDVDQRSFALCGLYKLSIQQKIEDHCVDFVLEPLASGAHRGRSIIEINPPPHHPRDILADKDKDTKFFDLGYQVYRESAENAKYLGYSWREVVIMDSTTGRRV